MKIEDFIGKRVIFSIRESDDLEGKLLGMDDRGFFLQDDDTIIHYISDNNNIISIDYDPRMI
jgi:hypothetical protein